MLESHSRWKNMKRCTCRMAKTQRSTSHSERLKRTLRERRWRSGGDWTRYRMSKRRRNLQVLVIVTNQRARFRLYWVMSRITIRSSRLIWVLFKSRFYSMRTPFRRCRRRRSRSLWNNESKVSKIFPGLFCVQIRRNKKRNLRRKMWQNLCIIMTIGAHMHKSPDRATANVRSSKKIEMTTCGVHVRRRPVQRTNKRNRRNDDPSIDIESH